MNSGKTMVGVKEFATESGISEKMLRGFCHIKGFPAFNSGVKILIHREAAKRWLADYSTEAEVA